MARKAKSIISNEDIEKLLEEKANEYVSQHRAWICFKNGYTYIGYDIYDAITEKSMIYLVNLINLMSVEYSIKIPIREDKTYYLIIEGEDKARADFIQKFIDNGYKLSVS